jgi:dynein heavy chain, axonemal
VVLLVAVSMYPRADQSACSEVSEACLTAELSSLIREHTCQMALVGLQLSWTHHVESALEKAGSVKTALPDAIKQQLMVLAELSSWCLTDLGSDLNRTKLETLVTVQVHQRDVMGDVARLFKEKRLQVCMHCLPVYCRSPSPTLTAD